ncbi:MAG: uroporphyrinogen-III C-methyltransferase, partial [Candidatus Accumulibacter sp.]|nr:uroporphyrinogen-III C-methyltransferase [Accumulibacter sp.]
MNDKMDTVQSLSRDSGEAIPPREKSLSGIDPSIEAEPSPEADPPFEAESSPADEPSLADELSLVDEPSPEDEPSSVDESSSEAESSSADESPLAGEPPPVSGQSPAADPPAGAKKSGFSPWLIVAVLALGLAGWQWWETRLLLTGTQEEMARRLAENDAAVAENRTLAKDALDRLTTLQGRLDELEERLSESKSQQTSLETLYQNLARGNVTRDNNDESLLTEVEQSVTLAAQQLQLAGNVQAAVLALETADTLLADQSRFINLRKVLTRDLERLRALPQLDLPGMYLRLESVVDAVGTMPLAVNARSRDTQRTAPPEKLPPAPLSLDYWRALATDFWRDLRGLVRIQRLDRVEPALLSPEQDFFLRENIKLRLLDARLAL